MVTSEFLAPEREPTSATQRRWLAIHCSSGRSQTREQDLSAQGPDLPEQKSKRRTAAEVAAEGGAGMIPFVGSMLAATLSALFSATQENRTREWMEEMAEVVQELLDRVDDLEAQSLADDPAFYDASVAAARISTATSSAEKRAALQNALFNVGMGDSLDADKRAIFLRYVDELTPSHIRLMRFLDSPTGWFEQHGLQWPNVYTGGLMSAVAVAFPEWRADEPFLDTLAADLVARGLIDNPGLRTMMTGEGLKAQRTKPKGREFLAFISGPFTSEED